MTFVLQESRVLPIEGAINLRDLGGYETKDGRRIKWHRIYRSGQLDRFTEAGCMQMNKLAIGSVIDLRTEIEMQSYPSNTAALQGAQWLSWQKGEIPEHLSDISGWRMSLALNDSEAIRKAMKENYPIKLYSHRSAYRTLLDHLINSESPVLFHCAAGKDRTGVGAAIILGLLGVPEETIIEDYLLTQEQLSDKLESWLVGGATVEDQYKAFQQLIADIPFEIIKPVFDADRTYIEYLLEYVNDRYQGFEAYAEKVLEVSEKQIEDLRVKNLEVATES